MKGKSQNTDYSMYKCYDGSDRNPFDLESQNAAHIFWFYESVFEDQFNNNESSDWYAFFRDHDLGDKLMKLLSEADYIRPQIEKKKQVFELWLTYLFTFKLYPEFGGKINHYKELYYSLPEALEPAATV